MKTLNKIWMAAAFTCLAGATLVTSSCIKKAPDYAPTKPLPTFGGYSSSHDMEPTHLLAYWNFNGNLTDSISKATGVPTKTGFSSGVKEQAFQGAANGYAVCNTPAGLGSLKSCTISAWINTPPPSTGLLDYFTLANTNAFWGNIEMFFDNGSTNADAHVRIHLGQNGNDNTFQADVPSLFGTWVSVSFSCDESGACAYYVNGRSAATGTAGSLAGALAFT